jgi:prepilin-type N-terminal cleavage/methylation domain-containing protein
MKTRPENSFPRVGRVIPNAPYLGNAAFTLIEMIGVMAIMAIMAATLAPNVLKSIERAAVRAEADTLRALGEQARLYLRDNAVPPTAANWNTVLGTYASLSPAEILTNRRQMNRVYVADPVAANQRALIVSSMRTGVATQTAAYIGANGTRFSDVWNWNTSAVPLTPPPGWGAWTRDNIEYLLIERVNFASVYRTDLQASAISLRNLSGATVSYRITRANGTVLPPVNLTAGTSTLVTPLYPKDQLALFRAAAAVNLDFTYVVGTTGKTYDFAGANWLPQ